MVIPGWQEMAAPHRRSVSSPVCLVTSILRIAVVGAFALVVGQRGELSGQSPASAPDRIVLRSVASNWIFEDQRDREPNPVFLDEVLEFREGYRSPDGASRSVRVESGSTEASVYIEGLGRVRRLDVRLPALSYPVGTEQEGVMERTRLRRLRSGHGLLVLPSGRFRDLWIALPRRDLTGGDRWIDTLAFVDSPGDGLEESYREIRQFTVLGDTVIERTPAYWLRTEGRVEYAIRDADFHEPYRVTIERSVGGRSAGRVAVDARTGLRMAGGDTLHMTGHAVLHDPVAGALDSGVEVHRARRWRHFDAQGHTAYRDSVRAARRGGGGMVMTPRSPVERRIASGDLALADSLIAAWKRAPDPDSATALRWALRWITGSGPWTRERLDSVTWAVQMERGDTADLVAQARDRLDRHLVLSEGRFLLPFLDDPERLWRLGAPVGQDYVELARSLLLSSPFLRPDSTEWRCRPSACAFWLDQYQVARDPRLRDAALVGLFGRDPARWYPEVRARSASGSAVVEPAIRMARGQPWWDRPAIPTEEASWRDWQLWWGPFGNNLAGPEHHGALRVFEAVTGRDPLGPWLERWPLADDSARLVMGRILRATGRLPELSPDEIRALLLAGETPPIGRGGGLLSLIQDGTPLRDTEATPFLEALVRSRIEGGGLPWPDLHPDEDQARRGVRADADPGPTLASFVVRTNLPEPVLQRLPEGTEPITEADRRLREFRDGAYVHSFERPIRWGAFVVLEHRSTLYSPEGPGRLPSVYASGGSIVLVETPDGWKVVVTDWWIT